MVYTNAPIREAVFDIKIDKLNIKQIEDLQAFKEFVSVDFPKEKKRHNITGMFEFSPDKPIETKAQSDITGYVFLSEDSTRQIQVRIDGITLNILKPYEKWETHFESFINNWIQYEKMFSPNQVTRIATRFINRIEIPHPITRFQDYILNMPPIPKCLPQLFSNFFMQIQVPSKDEFRNIILTETIEPFDDSVLPFILDIDVFQELNVDKSIEHLTINFNEMRLIKNEIFENCITDKTRQLFS